MKIRLLVFFLLLLSFKVFSQSCVLNATITQSSVVICSGSVATLTANGGDSYTWYDMSGNVVGTGITFNTPALTQTTTYYVVVSAKGCSSAKLPVTAIVNPTPAPPTSAGTSICAGNVANLHADGAAGQIFNWYLTPTGGQPLISSPDYTTPVLTATTTYYVESNGYGCASTRTPVTVTVIPLPATPDGKPDSVCYGSSATLTASQNSTGTYQWYDALAGGNLLATGNTFTTPALTNSTTYYVEGTNGNCVSNRIPVTVIVRSKLLPPSASGAFICFNSAAMLTASAQGGTFQWFDAATGGNMLASTATFTTPALTANTTYYVQNMQFGCVSPRTAVTVNLLAPIPAPTAAGTTVCAGSPATISALGPSGNYAWYDAATGGNLMASTQSYVTPALTATTTYYVEVISNGCQSARTPVTVTVNPIPQVPAVSGTTTCQYTAASLSASTNGGTAQWYDAATGGNLLATGNTYVTPVLTANKTYYVENQSGGCLSARVAVTVTVTPVTLPQFQYPSGTFCASGTNPKPAINVPGGGTFTASPSGLVIDPNTGEINTTASAPGNYTVQFTSNGECGLTTAAIITIGVNPSAKFSYNGPFCQDGINPFPLFTSNSSAGTFSASPGGLVFVNKSTGEINLAKSTPGKYLITNTIASTGGCPPASDTSSVMIYQGVVVTANGPQSSSPGTPISISGTISGAVTTGKWSGGAGTFSDPNSLNTTYTPASNESQVTLTLTSADPPGPCGPHSASITVTINGTPSAPTAVGDIVCAGSTATLSAIAPGGNYQWYDAVTGGVLLGNGANFTTPALTATTTYYVQTTVNGAISSRTSVNVIVNNGQGLTVQGAQICAGSTATLSVSGSVGGYRWYDAPTGGNIISVSNTFTTPVLLTDTNYYVEAYPVGCTVGRTKVTVAVTPVPHITSAVTGNICSGTPLNYTITSDVATVSFTWSRAQAAGITNAAVSGQASSLINETLVNTTAKPVTVVYTITSSNGTCAGQPFTYSVTVYPTPVITSAQRDTTCDMAPLNYNINFSVPVSAFYWSRDAVPDISNLAVSGQQAGTIKEVLFNTGSTPVNVTYLINYATTTCQGAQFALTVTVNPISTVTSAITGTVCSGEPQSYTITANTAGATYNWNRPAVAGISNPAVSNQTTSSINEALVNTTDKSITVIYYITPIAFGCTGIIYPYQVTVKPQTKTPKATVNSPVCVNGIIHLKADSIAEATYQWSGPNGFTSSSQNPDIANATTASAGQYIVTATVAGCTSAPDTVTVTIDTPPVASAGGNKTVCIADTKVPLTGTISGNTTGIWTTAGTGIFTPSANALNATYLPSDADKAAGSVVLTLTSTNTDGCNISASSATITFGPIPAADAGPDQNVCSQQSTIMLAGKILVGKIGTWKTSGTGTFSPSATEAATNYIPSQDDIKNGSVTLTLTATGVDSGPCYIQSDDVKIIFTPPAMVDAGGLVYVLKGQTATLNPTVSESNVHYLWSPDVDLSNDTLKYPVVSTDADRTYTLTVTDSRGCVSTSTVNIKVEPAIDIYNTFTPNNDGINDYWDIPGLVAYQQTTVDVFDRYGQKVFHSLGYGKPWDGTYNGKQLPTGTYYYMINSKELNKILSGYVTIVR